MTDETASVNGEPVLGGDAKAVLARIESALDRIEKASARPVPDHQTTERSKLLAERQSALEQSVRGSLAELDALIEKLEP